MPVQRPSNFGCFPNVSFSVRLCGKLSGGETSHCFLMTNCTGIPAIPESSNSRCFECPERHVSYSSQGSRIKYTSKGETSLEKFGLPVSILWDTFPPNPFPLLATDRLLLTPPVMLPLSLVLN